MPGTSSFASIDGLLAHAGWLNRLARHLVRDGDAAQDAVQEVWLAAGRTPPERGRPPRPWFARVLRNVVRRQARAEGRRRRWEAEAGEMAGTSVASPDAVYEQLELHRAVVECVMKLDEPLRGTLLFRYFEERSSFEIARLMEVPAGTVRRRLKTALEELRRELDRRFGTRRRWAIALAPAARLAMTGAFWKGALLMSTKLKVSGVVAAVGILLALIGGRAWLVRQHRAGEPATSATARASGLAVQQWPGEVREEARASLDGVVTDAQGDPVSGAAVVLSRQPDPADILVYVRRPAGMTSSDAVGRFHLANLREGRYVATASAAGRGPVRSPVIKLVNGSTAQVTLVLGRTGHLVEGRVLDADGQSPIVGARVLATSSSTYNRDLDPLPLFEALTDSRGAYRLTLATGEFKVRAEASGYAPIEEPVAATRSLVRDFRLRPAARVSGQIVERETRRPVVGADVWLTPVSTRVSLGFRQTRSDESGNFSFDDSDLGSYRVYAKRGRLSGIGPAVNVVEAQAVSSMEIAMDPMASVAGRVIDEKEHGIAGAKVALWSPDGASAWGLVAVSGADGGFRIEGVSPGSYGVRAQSAESTMLFNTDVIRVAERDVEGVKVVVRRGASVIGTVVAADGTPVPDAEIQSDAPISNRQVVARRASGADGFFRIPGLPAGRLVLLARHPEHGLGRQEVSVAEGQEIPVKIRLTELGASVAGAVKRRDGAPLGGASVAVTGQGGATFYGSATTGPDGHFAIGGLPAGRYTVWARPRGGPMNISTGQEKPDLKVVVLAAGERRTVDLTAAVGDKTVRGRVVFADGKPAAGASVVANTEEGGRSWKPDAIMSGNVAIVGPDGHFVMEGLDDGVYRLWASRPGFPDTVLKEVMAGRADLVIELRAPAGVAGSVVTKAGKPVPVYTMTVSGGPVAGESAGGGYLRTERGTLPPLRIQDPSGAFVVEGLDAGDYELKVSSIERGVASQRVRVGGGERKAGVRIVLEPSARVIGRVAALEGGGPIAGATIQGGLGGRSFSTSSRADGSFELSDLPPTDRLRIDIRMLGAENLVPEHREVAIPSGGATVDVGVVRLMKTEGPWFGRSRDGIGLGVLAQAGPDGVVVGELRPGSGPEKAGVKLGDRILAVDGRDVTKLGPGALMYFMYGPRGSTATLKLQTPGSEPRTITMVRQPPGPPAK
jgi:RNA polymerase sigma factor (sigma-70 family)